MQVFDIHHILKDITGKPLSFISYLYTYEYQRIKIHKEQAAYIIKHKDDALGICNIHTERMIMKTIITDVVSNMVQNSRLV